MTRTPVAWAAVATAYEPIIETAARPPFRALLVRRGGRLIRCDAFQRGKPTGLEFLFRCDHEHRTPDDALACAWQARTVEGYAATAPVTWGDRPDVEPAP